jgi:hypothetical protein
MTGRDEAAARVRALGEEADAVAAEWLRRLAAHGAVPADSEAALRADANALLETLLAAAAADTNPSLADVVGHLTRIREARRAPADDPLELIEALDLLAELLHDRLRRLSERADDAPAAGALAAATRLARVLRAMIAAAALLREPAAEPAGGIGPDAQQFIRRTSHDLKNPLGTARAAADMLREESVLADAAQRERFLAIIIRNIDRAVELLEAARRG